MYEVAPVAGNKVEAACALRSLQAIMGQMSSNTNHHHQNETASLKSRRSNRFKQRTVPKDDMAILRDPLDEHHITRQSIIKRTKYIPNCRPVTISEMNAYNIEKNEPEGSDKEIIKAGSKIRNPEEEAILEFYRTYHKTDLCYYKTPDGNYKKLPCDTFHKMTEGCYVKSADGTFRPFEEQTSNARNYAATGNDASLTGGTQTKVKNQMMRFLRRSKSHTPRTMERPRGYKHLAIENHKNKNKESETVKKGDGMDRKVVITMMENGGLPIVATSSKPRKSKNASHTNKEDTDETLTSHNEKSSSKSKSKVCKMSERE